MNKILLAVLAASVVGGLQAREVISTKGLVTHYEKGGVKYYRFPGGPTKKKTAPVRPAAKPAKPAAPQVTKEDLQRVEEQFKKMKGSSAQDLEKAIDEALARKGITAQEKSNLEKFKTWVKERATDIEESPVGEAAKKAGETVGEAAKRVGKFVTGTVPETGKKILNWFKEKLNIDQEGKTTFIGSREVAIAKEGKAQETK